MAAAAWIPGSILDELASSIDGDVTRLGTPSKEMSVAAHFDAAGALAHTSLLRTARILLKGFVRLPR